MNINSTSYQHIHNSGETRNIIKTDGKASELAQPREMLPQEPTTIPRQSLTAEDLNGLQKTVFDWADSLDQKDWDRLANNVTPELDLDLTVLGLEHWPNKPAAEFIAMMSAPNFLGHPALMGQHLVGASYFTWIGPDEVVGKHQIRATHQLYTDATRKIVKLKGSLHSINTHRYRKVNGKWKLAGTKPTVLWSDDDLNKMLQEVRQATNDALEVSR